MNDQDFVDSMVARITERLEQFDKGVAAANAALKDIGLNAGGIDEVALRFNSEQDLNFFIKHAIRIDGVKLFNYAVDQVEVYPMRASYGVKYWFLETGRGYRVECMLIDPSPGFSPLHAAHTMKYGFETPVHYSFKCEDYKALDASWEAMKSGEWTMVANCHSTYGQFSYWLTGESTDYDLEKQGFKIGDAYIKPRLNNRDQQGRAMVSEAAMEYLGSKA